MKLTIKKRTNGPIKRIVYSSSALNRLVGRIYVSKRIIDLSDAAMAMGIELDKSLLLSVLKTTACATSCTVLNGFGYIDISYYNGSRHYSGTSLTLMGSVTEEDLYCKTERLFNKLGRLYEKYK